VPRPLTPAELAFFNVRSESISRENDPDFYRYSFSQLTKGVGTMTTRMIDVSTDGIDTWVAAPAIVSTRSADTANIPIRLGNAGGSAAAATTLTLTMDSSLTYLTDTLDVTPTVATSGNLTTVRWQWPAMSSVAQRSGVVSVTVPDAPIGTAFEFAIAIGVENEAIPENNSVSGQISISEFVFLPTIQAGQ